LKSHAEILLYQNSAVVISATVCYRMNSIRSHREVDYIVILQALAEGAAVEDRRSRIYSIIL